MGASELASLVNAPAPSAAGFAALRSHPFFRNIAVRGVGDTADVGAEALNAALEKGLSQTRPPYVPPQDHISQQLLVDPAELDEDFMTPTGKLINFL